MPKKAPLKQDFVSAPMEKIPCDIMGLLPETENKNSYILVVSDYYTRYVEAYVLPDQTAQTVADCLVTEWICRNSNSNSTFIALNLCQSDIL